jgi:hypothetical protein
VTNVVKHIGKPQFQTVSMKHVAASRRDEGRQKTVNLRACLSTTL